MISNAFYYTCSTQLIQNFGPGFDRILESLAREGPNFVRILYHTV